MNESVSAPPPLTTWDKVWRNLVAITTGITLWLFTIKDEWVNHRWLFWTDLSLGLVALIAMQFRRRWPVAMTLIGTTVGLLSATSSGPASVTYVSMATRRRWVEIIPLGLLVIATGWIYSNVEPSSNDPWYVNAALQVAITAVVTAIGMYIGARRELIATLRERAERAETEQTLRIENARAQ